MPPDPTTTAAVGLPSRVAMIFGLAGLAVTQPMLDLFGRNPEFFIQGRYSNPTIVLFALALALVPGLQLSLLTVVAHHVHPALGRWIHGAILTLLGGALASVAARGLGSDGAIVAAVVAAVGGAVAVGLTRLAPGRLLLTYLAAGNGLFVANFLLLSPAGSLVLGGGTTDLGKVTVPDLAGPVVVVVLDEFPLTTLLRSDGTINRERFPAFAELADRTTWFRNTSSQSASTAHAVPAILTGTVSTKEQVPTYLDHPRNLFTLLGRSVPVDRYELLTDMCPASVCDPAPSRPTLDAFRDATVVYGHRLLPATVRSGLPAIDTGWGGFGGQLGQADPAGAVSSAQAFREDPRAKWRATPEAERQATTQRAILLDGASKISPEPGLHFIHVQLPHYPWVLTPWGTRLFDYPVRVEDPADPAYDWSSRQQYQIHSMQVGAADVAVGQLVKHMKSVGAWDAATVVITSDHGVSILPPHFGRVRKPDNEQQLLRVPLFVKAPGQTEGTVIDTSAQLIDVLPTLIDMLGIETDWDFDGHSLLDGSRAAVPPLVGESVDPVFDVARRHLAQIPGLDWTGLAAVGDHASLVGRSLNDVTVGRLSSLRWRPDHAEDFDDLPTDSGAAPQLLTGVVESTANRRPPELLVVVNGVAAGVAGGYQRVDGGWRFSSFLGPFLRTGANDIRAYEVETTARGTVLHEVT